MVQEDKQLLLKDLCGRLPYGVHGEYSWKCGKPYERELTGNLMAELILSFNSSEDSEFKPYLRPMASMTKEEKKVFNDFLEFESEYPDVDLDNKTDMYDWLNAHHFDYRGLIEKGLALEAPEDMYK